jgi:hypothetical protein
MRTPFTNVPLVEPRSTSQAPSWRGSMRACAEDANSSSPSATWFSSVRPIEMGTESTAKREPSASDGLETTMSRPEGGGARG